jgi:hypothetical protein
MDIFHEDWPTLIALSLAAVFTLAGLIHLLGPRPLREVYVRWDYPRGFHLVIGTFDTLAGVFLAIETTRVWGVVLGSLIMFVAVIILLRHCKYVYAIPAIVMMAAFPPALLASHI